MAVLRSRLLDIERSRREREMSSMRRSQVGTGERSEKIRTYNFPQDRVSDHRIGLTLHSLPRIMQGELDQLIDALATSECSPFPCDENRTCGLSGCYLSGKLNDAYRELKKVLEASYGDRVELTLTLIDDMVPDHIRTIIERDFPPIPMVLVNGRLTRIGRITLDRIKKEIEKEL
jgi:hypothetical protein